MAKDNLFSVSADTSRVRMMMQRAPDVIRPLTTKASHVSAVNILREQRATIARRTGQTADGLNIQLNRSGDGYVVLSSDSVAPQESARRESVATNARTRRRAKAKFHQGKHVALYLEEGTDGPHAMAARPFFFRAGKLEERAHRDRIAAAIQAGLKTQGLGD